jgi:hypothetical protein
LNLKRIKTVINILAICLSAIFLFSCNNESHYPILNHSKLAAQYFNTDSQWYIKNIPFFECSDKQIEEVYYYRWKMYKAHIRHVGDNEYVITEFINHAGWDREPYCTIDAASMHHIYEGRWLKDNRYIDGYIYNLCQQGGNNRHYSESIADAVYARYLVNKDSSFAIQQLDSLKKLYNDWSDHWDSSKNLYWIAAMPDATEYTIASVDASNGTGGFDSGEAFRPTINSYMYGNALAISRLAKMKGDEATNTEYLQKANELKSNIERDLWNDSLKHFTDRFKQNNQYVHYWDFIRGRELAGMIPWYFNLPADTPTFNSAWRHVTDTSELLGKFGLRTNEPYYQYYFKQFVMYMGQRGSQWNGPSWPYQTSQALTGMANFLNNYDQHVITPTDYVKILRQFAQQHYLPNGKLDLVENYDPNLGGPIVYYYWGNHYNHSSFNNLVITGLCGIRPSGSDTLVVNPLIDNSIKYFCLDGVQYHGHNITIAYDEDGSRYKLGKGLTVFVDGKKASVVNKDGKSAVIVGAPVAEHAPKEPADYALNITRTGYPIPSASVNAVPDTSLYQAIDGRIWYFPEITNRWTTFGSTSNTDWYAIDFGQSREISGVKIYFVADESTFAPPDSFTVEYQNNGSWLPVKEEKRNPAEPVGNTVTNVSFNKLTATGIRINFKHISKQVAVTEVECY